MQVRPFVELMNVVSQTHLNSVFEVTSHFPALLQFTFAHGLEGSTYGGVGLEGKSEGSSLGILDGNELGTHEGTFEGSSLGMLDGSVLGTLEGSSLGRIMLHAASTYAVPDSTLQHAVVA